MKYGDLTHKESLQFCEFILVSVYQTQKHELFLVVWCDITGPLGDQYDHYVAASVTQEQIDQYKQRLLSIRQIQISAPTLYYIRDGAVATCDELPYAELGDNRAPATSYYEPLFAIKEL